MTLIVPSRIASAVTLRLPVLSYYCQHSDCLTPWIRYCSRSDGSAFGEWCCHL